MFNRVRRFAFGALLVLCPAGAVAAETGAAQPPRAEAEARDALWLVAIRPARPELRNLASWTPELQQLAMQHGRYLGELHGRGVLTYGGRGFDVDAAGRLTPQSMAVVVLSAADRDSAAAIVASDPAVRGGLLAADIVPFEQVFPPR